MINKVGWIEPALLRSFKIEGTNAHRLCTIDDAWVERFGRDILISYQKTATRDRLMLDLGLWSKIVNFQFSRIFGRLLPKQNQAREAPRLLSRNPAENLRTEVTERKLKFVINSRASYSLRLFPVHTQN